MVAPRQTLFRHAIRGRKTTATFGGRSAAKNARDSATDSAMLVMPRDAQGSQFTALVLLLAERDGKQIQGAAEQHEAIRFAFSII